MMPPAFSILRCGQPATLCEAAGERTLTVEEIRKRLATGEASLEIKFIAGHKKGPPRRPVDQQGETPAARAAITMRFSAFSE
jgi:hypothetical protein